jgi:hypothetical protein
MLMVMVLGGSSSIAEYGGEEVKSAGSGGRKIAYCVLQALIHAFSTPRFIDIQNTDSRHLGI